ncbi:MAG: ferredoxin [Planctomycetes bacterium GWC2_49_10]|nr:MAG: ferredoxin [Planctomycetes bacterium GWC2_49_10]
MKTAYVDQDECISCGLCISNLPDVFRFADNDKAECYNPTGASEDDIQSEGIDACPVSCIHWREG